MNRKELVALLEEAMGVCDDMYERVPNVDFDGGIEEHDGTPKQIDDALTFVDDGVFQRACDASERCDLQARKRPGDQVTVESRRPPSIHQPLFLISSGPRDCIAYPAVNEERPVGESHPTGPPERLRSAVVTLPQSPSLSLPLGQGPQATRRSAQVMDSDPTAGS